MNDDFHTVTRILVVKLRAIGDVVLSTAILPGLRAAYPHAQIDFLSELPGREILEGNPFINAALSFNGREESGFSLIRRIRSRKYDMIIDLFGNPRSAIVTLLSGAKRRVGYRFGWRQYCYNTVVEPRGGEVHNSDFNLDALRALNIPIVDKTITIPLTLDAEKSADEFFREHGLRESFVVAMNPGGGWYTKRWPAERYAALGDALQREFNARILLTWGPGEESLIETISGRMEIKPERIPPVGLIGLAAMLKRCSAMVTNDSGPMHIAASMGTPIVAIFGPTRPELQGPVNERNMIIRKDDLDCLGCNLTKCPIGNPCMQGLTVEQVLDGFRALVKQWRLTIVSATA